MTAQHHAPVQRRGGKWPLYFGTFLALALPASPALAGNIITIPLSFSEPVTVTGTPRLVLDVGGGARYATYASGTGTSSLTFTYTAQPGDVDLDGIAITPSLDINGGSIKDLSGNALTPLTFTAPNTSGVKIDYPSLSMDFVNNDYILNGTHYAALSSLLTALGGTFSRSSTGTYYDSAGVLQTAAANTPRLDYAPTTHAANGILIEESRTNTSIRTTELDNAAWGKNNLTITADATTAPDGNTTAEYVVATGAGLSYITQHPTITAGNTITTSLYAKAGTSSKVIFELRDNGSFVTVTFNLATQTVTPGAGVTASIVTIGNGWYRLVATKTFTLGSSGGAATGTYYIDNYGTAGAGRGVYMWGVQTEVGASASSYIPTTATTATRSADTLSFPTNASWYSTSGVTWFANFQSDTQSGATRQVIGTLGGTNVSYGQLPNTGLGIQLYNNASTLDAASSNLITGERYAAATDAAGRALSIRGAAPVSDSALTPTSTGFSLGSQDGSTNYLQGHLIKLKHYPVRVPDTQLPLLSQ